MEIDPKYLGRVNRMRNLKLYHNSTNDEIYQAILDKEKRVEAGIEPPKEDTAPSYNQRFKRLFDKLQSEYGVDMNESNDVESLKMLVKFTLQLDSLDMQIRTLQDRQSLTNEDTRTLKNLGDFQRSIVSSITELQDRLGINRKARKEKQIDDIPAFIENLKKRAAEHWERETVKVMCETCKIELVRYWKNFPKRKSLITMELQCERCEQTIMYVN